MSPRRPFMPRPSDTQVPDPALAARDVPHSTAGAELVELVERLLAAGRREPDALRDLLTWLDRELARRPLSEVLAELDVLGVDL